jgi:hypothetical protein
MFRLAWWTRLTASLVVLALLPLAVRLDAIVAVFLLALVLAGLNVVEYARVERIGWLARLARRAG